MSAIDRSTAPASLAASFAPAPRRASLGGLRRAVVAAIEFADAYSIIEVGVVLVAAAFSTVLLAQALGFDLVG